MFDKYNILFVTNHLPSFFNHQYCDEIINISSTKNVNLTFSNVNLIDVSGIWQLTCDQNKIN